MAIENEDKTSNEDDAVTTEQKVEASPDIGFAEKKSNKLTTILMALIVGIPAGAILAYLFIPMGVMSSGSAADSDFNAHTRAPIQSAEGGMVRSAEPEWMSQQRAEMEKRHVELKKRNAESRAENMNSSEVPQWVKDQQAQAEKRQQEFEQQNSPGNQFSSEPPQWVKDQQAQMLKQQEKYQQEMAKRSAQPPWVATHPGVNAYPSAPVYQNQVPAYAPNRAPYYNGYMPPVNPYYYGNAPYYGPYNAPYGYPYR